MAVTRLKRKELRNKSRAKDRVEKIKDLTRMPPIKKVDIEKIKEEFARKSGKTPAAKKEDTKAVEKEPAKAQAKDTKTAEASEKVTKEPAKAQVKDTKAAEESGKEEDAAKEKE